MPVPWPPPAAGAASESLARYNLKTVPRTLYKAYNWATTLFWIESFLLTLAIRGPPRQRPQFQLVPAPASGSRWNYSESPLVGNRTETDITSACSKTKVLFSRSLRFIILFEIDWDSQGFWFTKSKWFDNVSNSNSSIQYLFSVTHDRQWFDTLRRNTQISADWATQTTPMEFACANYRSSHDSVQYSRQF